MSERWIVSKSKRYRAQVCFYAANGGYIRISPPFYAASLSFLDMHAGSSLFLETLGILDESNPHTYVTTSNATVLHIVPSTECDKAMRQFPEQVRECAKAIVDTLDDIDNFDNPEWIS